MVDQKTLAAYAANAEDYATRFENSAKPGASLKRFMDALPKGGRVLDFGCGTGNASGHLARAGFDVDAIDASPEMIAVAARLHGLSPRLGTFDDLDAKAEYDGVWANFSLLHANRDALPRHLNAIAKALKPKGYFHIGMKTGAGEHRDRIDRLYTFVTEPELSDLLAHVGMQVIHTQTGHEVGLAGTDDPWVLILARLS